MITLHFTSELSQTKKPSLIFILQTFYSNYDGNAAFDRMLEADLLQSQQQIKAKEAEEEERLRKEKEASKWI
jgi:hypothetical protein